MPPNKKYLTQSPVQRFAKISAGFAGGYAVTEAFCMALASWTHAGNVLMTLRFAGAMLWVALMILAFLARNGWKIWGLYLLLSVFFYAMIYLGNDVNPLV
ncbi:hypothetical protein SAMN02927921_03071 [Sinomicrobium oceani]|uniref:Uncharacterized protein n=1 Tax=Sinomicrobium oceani TaxID=1150368 RepID=A0A1K1R1A3_9FLAO|nr:hypothetical protein [Sinomicrobium oceani]SFW65689.1 hypothetical protein SAMN02927921_03071 [Sinomicrobium oceani]